MRLAGWYPYVMLTYARQRAMETLKQRNTAILITSGPAGTQACETPCHAVDLNLFLLVPLTSDHLFNLETDPSITLFTDTWLLKGRARILSSWPELNFFQGMDTRGCALLQVDLCQLQIRRKGGWGNIETIDLDG